MRSFLIYGLICSAFLFFATSMTGTTAFASGCDDNSSCGCGGDDCGYPYYGPRYRSCDSCGDSCRPMSCHDKTYCGPLTFLFGLFSQECWCGGGCGERYYGDFYGNPHCCDPCDRRGNYVGYGATGWSGRSVTAPRGCNCGGSGQGDVVRYAPSEGRVVSQTEQAVKKTPTPAKTYKTTRQTNSRTTTQ
jgi:hypothetical protein